MARYCMVAPLQILEGLARDEKMGQWHLLLAHDVVKHPKRYHNLFYKRTDSTRFVILDNSVVELGNSVDLNMIREAAEIVTPTCVVLPDAYLDSIQTAKLAMDALNSGWGDTLTKMGSELLMLPQGRTLREFATCAEYFADISMIKYWGVPRNLVGAIGSRKDAIQLVHSLNKQRLIHMFGFSDDLIDDVMCANDSRVFSIDSAVPVRCQSRLSLTTQIGPRGDWWETAVYDDPTAELLRVNLERARRWFARG